MNCGKHLQKLMCSRTLREFNLFLTFQYTNFTLKIAMHSMEISEFIFQKMFRGLKTSAQFCISRASRRTDTCTNP